MSSDPIAALYRANYDRLCRVAYRLTACAETSHDLVQDTFLLALFHRQELLEHPKPEAWLVTLVNLARNERRRFSHRELPLDALFALPAPQAEENLEHLLPARLGPQDRQVLLWRFRDQLDRYAPFSRESNPQAAWRDLQQRLTAAAPPGPARRRPWLRRLGGLRRRCWWPPPSSPWPSPPRRTSG